MVQPGHVGFCMVMTPSQFQSKLPQASGICKDWLELNAGLAPLSKSQQSPE